jgi:arylamine N-acetyltransferase
VLSFILFPREPKLAFASPVDMRNLAPAQVVIMAPAGVARPRRRGDRMNRRAVLVAACDLVAQVDLPEGPYLADVGFGNLAPTSALLLRPGIEQEIHTSQCASSMWTSS